MNNNNNENKSERDNPYRSLANFTQVGFTMAAAILVSVLLGNWLDDRLGTSPWLVLIFSLLGVLAAIRSLFHRPEDRK